MKNSTVRFRLLRLILIFSAFGWGISVLGIFLPWSITVSALNGLGAGEIPKDPMIDYWLRMTTGAFTLIGVIFLMLAINPRKYANILPIAGYLMIGEGMVLLLHGLRLGLQPFPFYGDTAFCLLLGIGIVLLQKEAKTDEQINS